MSHLRGGKIRGTHTTFIDLATEVVDLIGPLPSVTGISPGMIQNGKGVAGGTRKVKIAKWNGGVLLTVRQSRAVQEVRLLVTNSQDAMLAIARTLRNNDISICFKKD